MVLLAGHSAPPTGRMVGWRGDAIKSYLRGDEGGEVINDQFLSLSFGIDVLLPEARN